MFHKNFNRCLKYLLETAIVLSVTAYPIVDDPGIYNDNEVNDLAYGVCWDLDASGYLMENDNNMTAVDNCIHEFTGPTISSMKVASGVTIMCRKNTSIRYKITQSKKMQVLLLVTDGFHSLNTDHDIDYNLVEPETEYDMMLTMPGMNYTLWVTELDNGKPLQWRGGEEVPQYKELPHRDYNITPQFFYSNISKKLELTGVFTWNTSGDGDICFDVLDQCAELDNSYFDEWPTKNPRIVIKNLPPNETCSIQVTGIYGSTDFTYNTPPCEDPYGCIKDSLEARNPGKIEVMATEEDSNTWSIRVNWTRALIPPKRYKLTLWLAGNTSLQLPGNATEAVFHHVTGEGYYTVSIYSFIVNGTHTSVTGLFPPHSVRESNSMSVSIAWLVAAMIISILMTVCCWRGTQQQPIINSIQPKNKPSEETEVESVTVESEPVGDCWEVQSDSLLLHEIIGEGAFGVVRKGTMLPCGRDVAVKMLKDRPTIEEIRSFRSEMELMKSVGVHPHIVSLVGCCSGRRLLIIAEYCSRGDLLTYLRTCWDILMSKRNAKYYNNTVKTTEYKNDLFRCDFQNNNTELVSNQMYDLQELCDKELTNIDLLSFCRQIAKGMEYLSVNKVVHRDLAARNVLVTNNMTLKIADFGLSRDVYEENQYKQKGSGKLPVKWMALESLTRQIYSTQSDVWSFGVVMWEVVTVGGAPYSGVPADRVPRLLRAGYRMQRPHNCNKQLYELMRACWRIQPRDRPTFVQIQEELDKMLADASADRYVTLDLEPDDLPPTNKYNLLTRSNQNRARGIYEPPLMAPQKNHYSSSLMVLPKISA